MSRHRLIFVLAGGVLLAILIAVPAAARVRIVTKRRVSYSHFTSIQPAVDAASPGDWISSTAASTAARSRSRRRGCGSGASTATA